MESVPLEKRKKRESIFAIDVEMLNISAEVGDGVEMTVQVQSIFSENARIGVLLEGLMLNFNNARIFRSSRMQVSRIPNTSRSAPTAKHEMGTTWDWVVQALDVHICMPYRLELRAIDDSVEEMLRALKLVTAAKTKLLFPNKEEKSKPKETSSSKIGRVRFCIKKLTADIEEQPIQGWLDKHYQLLKKEACELAVRLNFLDEFISKGAKSRGVAEKKDFLEGGKIHFNGEEIDDQGPVVKGFKGVSSLALPELDVSLTRIEGGDSGMIEILQKLDPVPFLCEGRRILAQQATCFQPQIHQNVYIGRWRKVRLLRSASGTTPPMKTYSDLPLHFQRAEISYGVFFEPALADISYAFTVAMRRANLSIRNPSPDPPPLKKEKSLPWWDEMRNYIHGNTSLYFSESQWNILASADPYEKSDKLQIRSAYMELQHEGVPLEKVYDPFRSTSLLLRWNLLLRPSLPIHDNQSSLCSVGDHGVFDAAGCGPMEPDSLSVFPTPACLKHMPLDDDDPAKGLTFSMNKLKYELYYGLCK
ncbi:hypothetical protein P3S68_004977 [Capsicum galapagoense]